ncbi:MAG: hypothetical protein RBQ97_10980 [Acholeplasma sp.]|nr:hypothetical protein [Acholeplasma sp.]
MVNINTRKVVNSISSVDKNLLKEALSSARRTRKTVRAKIIEKKLDTIPTYLKLALEK